MRNYIQMCHVCSVLYGPSDFHHLVIFLVLLINNVELLACGLEVCCYNDMNAVQTPGGHQIELNLRPVTELRILYFRSFCEPARYCSLLLRWVSHRV